MQLQTETGTQPAFSVEPALPSDVPQPRWGLGQKIAFRFAFVYLVLYCLPFPFNSPPFTEKIGEWWERPLHKLVPWIGQHVLRLSHSITVFSNGSGDTTYDYVKALFYLVISVVAALAWSALDRKRDNYQRLHEWLRLYVRLNLAAALVAYGAFKIIPSQFPSIGQWQYLKTYGDASPMGILWTFMGASKSYTIFAGAVEAMGGFLLFIPRLTTLGALVAIGAMGNVFILNMSYDVPVKLYSFHLLLIAIFLVLPDLKRLASFFVLNRPTEPSRTEPLFRRKWAARSLLIVQLALGIWFLGAGLYQSRQSVKTYVIDSTLGPPLYGTWAVDEFTLDGQPRPPLLTDDTRWQKVIFEFNRSLIVQGMDGKLLFMSAKMDTEKKTIALTKRRDANWKTNLSYDLPTKDVMLIEGDMAGKKFYLKLHRTDPQYLLKTRGFHWINELPFNR
jgi:uncharacterized membrane protein YphA (DoxX/SURF4 family)